MTVAAEEIASGYLSIGPALVKDFRAKLDAQLKPVATQVGQTFAKTTAQAMPAGIASSSATLKQAGTTAGAAVVSGVEATVGPRLKRVLEQAAQSSSVGFITKLRGVAAAAADEFSATGKITGTARAVSGQLRITRTDLSTFRTALQETASSSGVLRGGLAGVTGLLGGPWGIALAGAGIALNTFIQGQAEAKQAAQDFADTIDEVTGKLTEKSFQSNAASVINKLLDPGAGQASVTLQQLKDMGFSLEEITRAVTVGGDELTNLLAKIQSYNDAQDKLFDTDALERGFTLQRVVEGVAGATEQGRIVNEAATAAMRAGTDAADEQGVAVNRLSLAATGLASAINSIPGGASVVITTNLAQVINEARQALGLLAALGAGAQYSAGAAINDYLAGLGSGKYEDPIAAAQKRAEEAAAKARAAAAKAAREATAAANKAAREAQAAANKAAREAAAAAKRAQERIQQQRESLQNTLSNEVSRARQTAIPDITSLPRSAPGIVRALKKQLFTLRRFKIHLTLLAKRGLPKVFLQQLIEAGLDGADTAQALVNAKASDFNEIKRLAGKLNLESVGLAKSSVKILYGTGQNAVKALVKGMDAEQRLVEAQMLKIAKSMKKAIEKALGIKSPSRVFLAVGRNVADATALGMDQRRRHVAQATSRLVGLPRVPRPAGMSAELIGAALATGQRPFIEGGLHMHNPVEKTLNGSTTDALRQAAFLIGQTA